MSTKIRHVLEPNGLYAVYFYVNPQQINDKFIYATIQPCLYTALVSRQYGDEWVDEIVGFIISKDGIVPADEPGDENMDFQWYIDRDSNTDDSWRTLVTTTVPALAETTYRQNHPEEAVVSALPPSRSKRKGRA